MPIDVMEIEGAFGRALVQRLTAEMREAGGDQATVSGLGPDRAFAPTTPRATVIDVSDARGREVQAQLADVRPKLAEHFARPLDTFETRFRHVSVVILLVLHAGHDDRVAVAPAPGTLVAFRRR